MKLWPINEKKFIQSYSFLNNWINKGDTLSDC